MQEVRRRVVHQVGAVDRLLPLEAVPLQGGCAAGPKPRGARARHASDQPHTAGRRAGARAASPPPRTPRRTACRAPHPPTACPSLASAAAALALFLEQQKLVGASAALCENIGHTLSSLGQLPRAEEYFEKAIALLERGSYGNRGGIYMGLGLVRDRLGKTREALPILRQSLEHYQKEHTNNAHQQLDSSIIAKAHMSLGRCHEKLDELEAAATHMAEALAIFRRTVGGESPLTANAMGALGKVRAARGETREALALLKGALTLEVGKDAFHLETSWDLLSRLKDLHMEGSRARQSELPASTESHLSMLQATYSQFIPLVSAAARRITTEHEEKEAGTLGVFYKTAGELCMLAQSYALGEDLLAKAIACFGNVSDFDCSSLVEGCEVLLEIAKANAPKVAALAAAR